MKGTLTSNLTILFTDMEGFTTRTSELSRDQIDSLLVVHERITANAVKEYGGTIIKNLGDGYLLSFQSPTNAILCAMRIQKDISVHNSSIPKAEYFWVRIAANSGEVAVKDGDVFGEPVNVASRLLAQTEPGDIALTESVYLAMNKTEIPTTPAGTKILRGVPEAIRVYRVPRTGEKAVFRKKDVFADTPKTYPLQSRINLPFVALACLIAIISFVSMRAGNWGPLAHPESDILGTETEGGSDQPQPNFFQKLFGGFWPEKDTGTNTSITGPYDSIFTSGTSIGSTYGGNSGTLTSPTSTPKSRPRNTNGGSNTNNENNGSNTGSTPVPTQAPTNPTPVSCPPGHVVVNNQCVNRPQASVTPVQTPAPTPVPTGTQNQGNGNSGNATNGNSGNNSNNSGTGTGNSKKDTKSNNGQNNDNGNNGNGSIGSGGSDTGSSGSDTNSNGKSKNK